MSFKYHISNHFSGCRLLAETHDVYRNRPVKVYMMPSVFEHVGVSDGTDAWVAPVVADPFKVNVRDMLGKIQAGEEPDPVIVGTGAPPPKARRRLFSDALEGQAPEVPRRRVLAVVEAPTPRRRILS